MHLKHDAVYDCFCILSVPTAETYIIHMSFNFPSCLTFELYAQDDEATLSEEEQLARAESYDPMDEVEMILE